ncbi:MAG: 23S rRNA (adenine(1618)-N(6))-methyltransferase RlmF [Nibricoccus sp.]
MHARNVHRAPYDFPRLVAALSELARFVEPHPLAGDTVDFSNPAAVLTLNRALLKLHYGIAHWDLPSGYLCPPIPSRADYLHYAADLLTDDAPDSAPPRGNGIRALDIGTGADCIYPLLGTSIYGWHFTATDIDSESINWAHQLVTANPTVSRNIELRLQPSTNSLFQNIARSGESFALSLCNPPFHSSPEEAAAGTQRKLKNLHGIAPRRDTSMRLNFGGRANELWCPGGEVAFIRRMIAESADPPRALRPVYDARLKARQPPDPRTWISNASASTISTSSRCSPGRRNEAALLTWTFLPGHWPE